MHASVNGALKAMVHGCLVVFLLFVAVVAGIVSVYVVVAALNLISGKAARNVGSGKSVDDSVQLAHTLFASRLVAPRRPRRIRSLRGVDVVVRYPRCRHFPLVDGLRSSPDLKRKLEEKKHAIQMELIHHTLIHGTTTPVETPESGDEDEAKQKKPRVRRPRGGKTSWWYTLMHEATRDNWFVT